MFADKETLAVLNQMLRDYDHGNLNKMLKDYADGNLDSVVRCKDCRRQTVCYKGSDYFCCEGEKIE